MCCCVCNDVCGCAEIFVSFFYICKAFEGKKRTEADLLVPFPQCSKPVGRCLPADALRKWEVHSDCCVRTTRVRAAPTSTSTRTPSSTLAGGRKLLRVKVRLVPERAPTLKPLTRRPLPFLQSTDPIWVFFFFFLLPFSFALVRWIGAWLELVTPAATSSGYCNLESASILCGCDAMRWCFELFFV